MTKVQKEEPRQSRTCCCDLSFPLQFGKVGHALLSSLPVVSVATYSSWCLPFSQFSRWGTDLNSFVQPLVTVSVSSSFAVSEQSLGAIFWSARNSSLPLWQFHLGDPKVPQIECSKWIYAPEQLLLSQPHHYSPKCPWQELGSHPELPGSSSCPRADEEQRPVNSASFKTPLPSLHSPHLHPSGGHYHLFPGLLQ